MKHTKLWSCLLAVVLLISCAVGIFAVGADAENTVIYYTLGEVEKVKEIVTREMTTALDFGVPLDVGIGVGSNWLDAH